MRTGKQTLSGVKISTRNMFLMTWVVFGPMEGGEKIVRGVFVTLGKSEFGSWADASRRGFPRKKQPREKEGPTTLIPTALKEKEGTNLHIKKMSRKGDQNQCL